MTPSDKNLFNCLRETKDLLETCERVLITINDVEQGTLVIGVQSHIVRNYLMSKIDDFRLKHPKIKIELIDMSTNQLLEQLVSRKIDFIIDAAPIDTIYNNISITPLCALKNMFYKIYKK